MDGFLEVCLWAAGNAVRTKRCLVLPQSLLEWPVGEVGAYNLNVPVGGSENDFSEDAKASGIRVCRADRPSPSRGDEEELPADEFISPGALPGGKVARRARVGPATRSHVCSRGGREEI